MTQAATGRTWGHGKKTAAGGTAYSILVPPAPKKRTKITEFEVTVGITAHTMTVMRPLNSVLVNADAAQGQAVVVLAKDPGSYSSKRTANNLIGVNHWLCFECPDGTFYYAQVHASTAPVTNGDGTVTVTMAANLPTLGIKKNARCWFYGATTDTEPTSANAEAHPQFTLAASSSVLKRASEGSLVESNGFYEPLIVYVDNASNASTLEGLQAVYGP